MEESTHTEGAAHPLSPTGKADEGRGATAADTDIALDAGRGTDGGQDAPAADAGRGALLADKDAGSAAEAAVEVQAHGESKLSVIAAVVGNLLIGVVKFVAAAISGSSAMISEGIHSVVDSGNGLLILFGMKRSSHKPDLLHPFGYGKELYFWSLVVAVMIFALGGGFSIYEGATHLMDIGPDYVMGSPTMSYIILAIAAVIEGASLTIALRQFNRARGDLSPFAFIREAKDPSLFTVVLEDSAAEAGLVIAFLGIFIGHLTGNPYCDGIASCLIGCLLCVVAIVLLRETKDLLIGEGLGRQELVEANRIAEAVPGVRECGRILSMYIGPYDLLVAMDVTFETSTTEEDIVHIIDQIEQALARRFPEISRVFIEAESFRKTRAYSERYAVLACDEGEGVDEL